MYVVLSWVLSHVHVCCKLVSCIYIDSDVQWYVQGNAGSNGVNGKPGKDGAAVSSTHTK